MTTNPVFKPLPSSATPLLKDPVASPYSTVDGPYTATPNEWLWLEVSVSAGSDAVTGTVELLRSPDGGTTLCDLTKNGVVIGSLQLNGATGTIFNEALIYETEKNMQYYLRINLTAGSIRYRISQ